MGLQSKRDQEQAGVNYLLAKMLNNDSVKIVYTAERKPMLRDSPGHISISHSHSKLAIIYNRRCNTGVDIELVREKVKSVEHKFLNQHESLMAEGKTQLLITLWAAKETLYKLYGKRGVDFRQHLFIDQINESTMQARIEIGDYKKKYELAHESIGEYKLVYALNEIY